MSRSTLEWYELMARGLTWSAGIVLVLALVAAVVIAGSDTTIPLLQDAERQGRGIAALASLAGGLTSAGVLGGLGALLRLNVSDRLERLGPAPEGPTARANGRAEATEDRTLRRGRNRGPVAGPDASAEAAAEADAGGEEAEEADAGLAAEPLVAPGGRGRSGQRSSQRKPRAAASKSAGSSKSSKSSKSSRSSKSSKPRKRPTT